eukprot:667707-Prorocentrum_minimum.AAC.1
MVAISKGGVYRVNAQLAPDSALPVVREEKESARRGGTYGPPHAPSTPRSSVGFGHAAQAKSPGARARIA